MATYTQLSLIGTPGKRYSFSPKTEAVPEAGPHIGTFTELSATGTPGKIHSFIAKTAATPEAGDHIGLFTALSIIGGPGRRHSFSAKQAYVATQREAGGGWIAHQADTFREAQIQIHKEDEEMLEIIMQAVLGDLL